MFYRPLASYSDYALTRRHPRIVLSSSADMNNVPAPMTAGLLKQPDIHHRLSTPRGSLQCFRCVSQPIHAS